jgi:hypothetical protein
MLSFFSKHGMQVGFPLNLFMHDSITFSPQIEHEIESRILAGSGSGMDVGSIERMLSLDADMIHLERTFLSSGNSSGIPSPWKYTRTPDLDDRQ